MLKGQCHAIFCFRVFHESPSPKPLIITLGSFRIFLKIRGDIRKSRCTTSVNNTGGNLPPVSSTTSVNDTGGEFATVVNDTGSKLPPVSTTPTANLHRYQLHRWQILPPVSLVLLTPVANLPPVSTTPVANCHRNQRHRRQIMGTISGC